MKEIVWTHCGVRSDGTLESGGRVETTKSVRASTAHECLLPFCKCLKGPWVSVSLGLNEIDSTMRGTTFYFDDLSEFNSFLAHNEITVDKKSGEVFYNLDRLEPILVDRNLFN